MSHAVDGVRIDRARELYGDEGLIVGVHDGHRAAAHPLLPRVAVHSHGSRTRFEHHEVFVDDDDRVRRRVEDRLGLGEASGQGRFPGHGVRDVASDEDQSRRRSIGVANCAAPDFDRHQATVQVVHPSAKRVEHEVAVLGVHEFGDTASDAVLSGHAVKALRPGVRFEDREVSVDDDDRVRRGVEDRPGGLSTFGQLRFDRNALSEVAHDEDGLVHRSVVDSQRVTSGFDHHPVAVGVMGAVPETHDLVGALVEHALQGELDGRAVVRVHQLKDAGPARDVVVVAEETLSPRTVLGDYQFAIDDDDEVGRRREDGLGHLHVRRQFGGVRVARRHVATGGVDQVAASLRRPLDPAVRTVATSKSILESGAGLGLVVPLRGAFGHRAFDVVGVDEFDERAIGEILRTPAEHPLPRRVRETESSPYFVDRQQVGGVPEVLAEVGTRHRFKGHYSMPFRRSDPTNRWRATGARVALPSTQSPRATRHKLSAGVS